MPTAPVIGYDDYDPWGYPLAGRTKPIPNAYLQGASKNKFTGKEWDDEFGLKWYHFDWRPLDGEIGRWFIVDPLWEKHPDVSPYNYALNNPLLYIDPDGQQVKYYGTPPPSWAQIKQNFAQRIERSKEYASEGVYTMAVGTLIWAPIAAFGEMDAGISVNVMTMGGKAIGAAGQIIDEGIDATRALSKVGEAAAATKGAYEIAKKGGRHSGLLEQYAGKTTREIEKALSSYEKQVAIHEEKLANPAKFAEKWKSMSREKQQGLLQKWQKDIRRNKELADIMQGILEERIQ